MIRIHSATRTLILVMGTLVVIAVIISRNYYRQKNSAVDPRIVSARELYASYNELAAAGNYDSLFLLLDSIEAIYDRYAHYRNSYERGVLYNNRAAAWLTMGLYQDSTEVNSRQSLFKNAEGAVRRSIQIYSDWKASYGQLERSALKEAIHDAFLEDLAEGEDGEPERYLENRIEEMVQAQEEIDRRLSVSYTNLGVICREKMQYDSAMYYYTKALDLWDRNLTAENNINKLLGRPEKKRNIIQKLFPPERL